MPVKNGKKIIVKAGINQGNIKIKNLGGNMKGKKDEKPKYLCSNCNGIIEGTPETCPHCGAFFDTDSD